MHRTELFHEPPKSHFRVLRYEIKKLPCKEEIFISHWVSKELAQSFDPCFKKEERRAKRGGGCSKLPNTISGFVPRLPFR